MYNNTIRLNLLFNKLSKKKKSKLLGRGIGCGKGKTSGRGHKGQKARSGVSINGFEGGQQSIYTRLPKRGFNNKNRSNIYIINTGEIQNLIRTKKIVKDSIIDRQLLYKLGFLKSVKGKIKLLNKGNLNERCIFHVDFASKAAKKYVNSIGGDVRILSHVNNNEK